MFLIRNRNIIANFVRHRRDIFTDRKPMKGPEQSNTNNGGQEKINYQYIPPPHHHQNSQENASQNNSHVKYPYKFGGINSNLRDVPQLEQEILPKNSKPAFFKLYISLLEAINKKDDKTLSQIVEPSLVAPLLDNNIRTILKNQNSQSYLSSHSFTFLLGTTFARKQNMKYTKMGKQSQQIGMYIPANMDIGSFSRNGKFPMLFSFRSTIKSKAKLCLEGLNQTEKQQSHTIDFQFQRNLQITSMMGILASTVLSRQQMMKKALFGGQVNWKIGNIDNFLKQRWQ